MIVVAIIMLRPPTRTTLFPYTTLFRSMNACINNLRQIDGAGQQWALETKQNTNATPVFSDVSPYWKSTRLYSSHLGTANVASSYTLRTVSSKPTCQILSKHVLPVDTTG